MSKQPTPQNLEAEQAVLGSILIESGKALPAAQAILAPSDFVRDAHRYIYQAAQALTAEGQPVDLITLEERLRQLLPPNAPVGATGTQFDIIGGRTYLLNLMEAPSTAANIAYYAEIVKKASTRRRLMETAREAYFLAKNDPDGLEKLSQANGKYHLAQIAQNTGIKGTYDFGFQKVGTFLATLPPPPPWVVEQLLPANALILLTGKPKHGKSFTAMEIADCVSTGSRVFGEYEVKTSGPVVYFDMENSRWTAANRALARGISASDPRPLYISHKRILFSASTLEALKDQLKAIKPLLVIIDTAAEGLGIKKWEDRGEVVAAMAPVRDFARDVCTVLLVAHNRKADGQSGDEIAGSNAFAGAVDGWMSFSEKTDLPNGNLRIVGRMDGRDIRGDLVLEVDHTTHKIKALTKEEIGEEKKALEKQGRFTALREALCEAGGKATIAEIADRMSINGKAAWILVTDAVKAGKLKNTGETEKPVGRGRPAPVYALCDLEEPETGSDTLAAFFAEDEIIPDPFADEHKIE